jgi:uncharacterized protein DUF397
LKLQTDTQRHLDVAQRKHHTGPTLVFTDSEWEAFLAGAKTGEFDK